MTTRRINAMRMLLAPLKRKLQLMFTRGSVLRSDDAGNVQSLQVSGLKGEVHDAVPRYQPYGFTSRPLGGAKAMLLSLFGTRSKLIALVVEDGRYRLKNLAEGEVALYTAEGDYVHFKNGRIIEVVAGTAINVTAPVANWSCDEVNITGKLNVGQDIVAGGDVSDQKGSMNEMRTTYNNHNMHPPKDFGQDMK